MRIAGIFPQDDWTLKIVTDDGHSGVFDVRPYLAYDVFKPLLDRAAFHNVTNRGYFIEWECGADLSADTIESRWMSLESMAADSAG